MATHANKRKALRLLNTVRSLENIQQPANWLLIPDYLPRLQNIKNQLAMDLKLEAMLMTYSYVRNENRST